MNLSRSDTYINVYIPREDGTDPRKFVPLNSPMFGQEKIFKFSEQVKKDRNLFLGKKQLSLYELYYKSKEGVDSAREPQKDGEVGHSEGETDENENRTEHEFDHYHGLGSPTPALGFNVNKVSLSLDSQTKLKTSEVKHLKKLKRFNEPLNSYVSNKKKVTLMRKLDAEDYVERAESVYDLLREPTITFSERVIRPSTFHVNPDRHHSIYAARERQYTFYNSRQKTFYGTTYRSQASPRLKKPSFEVETKLSQSNELPPINSPTKAITVGLGKIGPSAYGMSSPRALPIRPSSKPMKIYRQTTELLLDGWTPKLSDANGRYLAVRGPQQRANIINLGQHSAF